MSKIKKCKICGRKLTNKKSIIIGIGPTCLKKTIKNKIKEISLLKFLE